jgi:hypothetical protein
MSFKEVSSLDADVTVSIGKRDKKTGKMGPKSAEGYYLGNRTVQNKRGPSTIHFLQTPEGNLGVWGTTDMNRKLSQVTPGTMVRITSTGTKPTPNGDMYTYRVELDSENTIEVGDLGGSYEAASEAQDSEGHEAAEDSYSDDSEGSNEEETPVAAVSASSAAARKAKVEALLNGKGKSVKAN